MHTTVSLFPDQLQQKEGSGTCPDLLGPHFHVSPSPLSPFSWGLCPQSGWDSSLGWRLWDLKPLVLLGPLSSLPTTAGSWGCVALCLEELPGEFPLKLRSWRQWENSQNTHTPCKQREVDPQEALAMPQADTAAEPQITQDSPTGPSLRLLWALVM